MTIKGYLKIFQNCVLIFGKGYRIYYTEINGKVILLINGGDKSEQSKNIEKAQKLLNEWRLSQ